jgi:hypothetical protein
MDINLTTLFVATLVLALISIISTILTHSRIAKLEQKVSERTKSASEQVNNKLFSLSELVNEQVVSLEKNSERTATKQEQLIKSEFEAVIKTLALLKSDLTEKIEQQFKNLLEDNKNIKTSINKQLNINASNINEKLDSVLTKVAADSVLTSEKIQLAQSNLTAAIYDLSKEQNKIAFVNNQKQLASFELLTNLVQSVRIDNIIELTNELGKHNELTVETEDFVKQLGDCKVLKIKDKYTDQVTQVYYDNGIKRSTDTFAGDDLKYQMFFDDAGKAVRGIELNEQGNITFEYLYDEAGEVNKRIEYVYDKSGNLDKVAKSY